MQNILVHINDVSHVKLLSKDYMVHLICLHLNRVECEHPKRYTHILLPRSSAIHAPKNRCNPPVFAPELLFYHNKFLLQKN